MKMFFKILTLTGFFTFAMGDEQCIVSVSYSPSKVEYTCVGISTLDGKLYGAYTNTTDITIQDSNLIVIPG